MAITTKQTLSNKKFRQSTLDELNLNGKVIIGGELSLNDGNHGVGKIITSNANGKFVWTQTGIPNGVATLDSNGLVPASQLPSYVDDVLEFDSFATLPAIGETGKIYVTKDTNSTYRWSGSQYIKVNDAVSTSETATKLATPRNIQATGDATWQVTFDGSKNVTAALTLANTGVTPNSYGNNITIPALTIDSKGRITSVTTNTVRSATQSVSGVMSAADKTKLDGIATGANKYTHPNHTGDVTSNGDGATVISNDAVTNAKLANMSANTIKGRLNSSGDPQDLTAAQVRSLLNVADGAEVNVQSDWNQTSTNADDYIKNKPSIPNSIDELGEINPNTIIGNDLSIANSPKQINISENQFLGRLTGENIKGVEAINMYGLSSGTKTLLENNSNWDENGVYTGTTITDAKSGQKHYDLNYLYEFVTDSTPIRTIRYTVGLAEVATTGSYYDLVDVPEYYTYVVHNISEFVEATQTLSGSSGTILLANNITLTSNLTNINLQNIKVDGNGNAINFYNQGNFYHLQTNSSKITFDNVVLRGGFESSFGGEKILEFGSSGYFMFNNVTFRDVSKFSNDLNQTFPTIIQFNSNANLFLVQCRYSGYNTNNNTVNSTIYPLIFNFTPSSGSDGYLHIYLNDFRNVLNQTYVGFTGKFANSSDRYIRYNDLTRDVSVNILTGASYLDFNSLGSEFVYGDNNYTHPNHTGDVTSSGDGATVIANNVVTNTKLADMSASTIKGRLTGSGDPQDLTVAQVRTLLNVADGANNYTHPNHTGDVTSSGDGATVIAANAVTSTKISNDAVTNSKLANMGANTIKGRLNSIGDPQDLTVTQVKTLLSLKSISEKDYWYGSQATYDAISTKDANTIYFIPEP